jgi:hypothetical protein
MIEVRRIGTALAAAALLSLAPAPATAGFFSTGWTLNGDALLGAGGQSVRLTPGAGSVAFPITGDRGQVGSAFRNAPITLDPATAFSFSWQFRINDSPETGTGFSLRGDGLTMVLQNVGPGFLGLGGSDLGYIGGGDVNTSSIGVALDTFNFLNEMQTPSLVIVQDDAKVAGTEVTINGGTGMGNAIRGLLLTLTMGYMPDGLGGGTFSASLTDAAGMITSGNTTSLFYDDASAFNFGPDFYLGFTAANGWATDEHVVLVPLPGALALMLGGAALLGWFGRRRAA